MEFKQYSNATEYKDIVFPILLQNEAENCVAVETINTIAHNPKRFPGYKLFTIEDAGKICGVSYAIPPHPLWISRMQVPQVIFLAKELSKLDICLNSALGVFENIKLFCEEWRKLTGYMVTADMNQRIYELQKVIQPENPTGNMRFIEEKDRELMHTWSSDFFKDCNLPELSHADLDMLITQSIEQNLHVLLLVNENPVAMARYYGKTPSGIRIGFVYTPPKYRGKGFASHLVANLSKYLLDSGHKACYLYTDASNPASNKMYPKIGYRHVADSLHAHFNF